MLSLDSAYYTQNITQKYNIHTNNFMSGLFFSFGFSNNSYSNAVSKIFKNDIKSALKSDWIAVGNDFKNVIDTELIDKNV